VELGTTLFNRLLLILLPVVLSTSSFAEARASDGQDAGAMEAAASIPPV